MFIEMYQLIPSSIHQDHILESNVYYQLRSRGPCKGSKCIINLNRVAEMAICLLKCINEYHSPFTQITFLRAMYIITYPCLGSNHSKTYYYIYIIVYFD